jgi:hypothetical protein
LPPKEDRRGEGASADIIEVGGEGRGVMNTREKRGNMKEKNEG